MDRDFVYCPGCSRYSIVLWRRDVGAWECEDCSYSLPSDRKDRVWTAPETLAS
jgi:ribosomal protein L37AE/L43A